jgi:predicted RND superfamily exporter protein
VADPQVMQQFDTMKKPNTNEEEEEDDYADMIQQFNNAEPNTNEEDYTEIEDS